MVVIDSDQHLFEARSLWRDHVEPAQRDDALRIEDDALGHAWLRWRDVTLGAADVQVPGETDAIGERRRRERSGAAPLERYDESLPREMMLVGFDGTVGLSWRLEDTGFHRRPAGTPSR